MSGVTHGFSTGGSDELFSGRWSHADRLEAKAKAKAAAEKRGEIPHIAKIEHQIKMREHEDRQIAISREGNVMGVIVGVMTTFVAGPLGGLAAGSLTAAAVKTTKRWIERQERREEEGF